MRRKLVIVLQGEDFELQYPISIIFICYLIGVVSLHAFVIGPLFGQIQQWSTQKHILGVFFK